MDEEINYRVLRKIQQMEKNSPTLTDIKNNFYTELKKYLNEMDKHLENETSSQKRRLLEDEIDNVKKIAQNIYEQREKKIILAAITKARGGHPDLKKLVDIEKNLFNSVLNTMKNFRQNILEGEKEKIEEKNIKKVESEEKKEVKKKQSNDNPVLLIKEDILEFIGTDTKRYNLCANDVISLPKDMADMLTDRDVAKKINFNDNSYK